MNSHGLFGFEGQDMSGERSAMTSTNSFTPYATSYPGIYTAATQTWVCPATGTYKFMVWGAGGPSDPAAGGAGGGGGYAEKSASCTSGQSVTIYPGYSYSGGGISSYVTLPSGTVTAGGGAIGGSVAGGAGGVATGGDVNYSGGAGGFGTTGTAGGGTAGGAGGAATGGGGAGGATPYNGGTGGAGTGDVVTRAGYTPGGGGSNAGAAATGLGGNGLILILRTG